MYVLRILSLTLTIGLVSSSYSLASSKEEYDISENKGGSLSLSKTPASSSDVSPKGPSKADWADIQNFIVKGIKNSCQNEGLDTSAIDNVQTTFVQFRAEFTNLYRKGIRLSKDNKNIRALKELLSIYFKVLTAAYSAFDTEMKIEGGAYQNQYGITSRSQYIRAYDDKFKPFFTKFQRVSHILLSSLNDLGVSPLKENLGIIRVDHYAIGYCKDDNGFVPYPFKIMLDLNLMNLTWGQFDPYHQRTFLIKEDSIMSDSGFVSTVHKGFLKIQGYYGLNSSFPYSSYPDTARLNMAESNHPWITTFKEAFGEENWKEGKVGFIPFPSTNKEWGILEVLFLEGIDTVVNNNNHPSHKQALDYKSFLEKKNESPLENQKNKLESSLLNAFEDEIHKQQEEISKRVASNEVYNATKQVDKKPGAKGRYKQKNKNARPKTEKQETKLPEVEVKPNAKEVYEKYKVESRVKFKGITQILNNLIKEFPSSEIKEVIRKGSHINFHGEGVKGATLVDLHEKESASPYVVNALISNFIGLLNKKR